MKKPKVVFTFVEAGMGHIVPATGISDAFEKKYGDKCEVIRWNIFSESKNPIVNKYATELFGWVKKAANNKLVAFTENISYMVGSKMTLKFLDFKFRKAKKAIMEEIKEVNPDLICSTFYSPSHFALEARAKGMIDPLVATCTADPIVYPAWDRRSDLFFVNNDLAYDSSLKTGFKKEQVYQVPFILRKEIKNTSKNKQETRRELGLDENKFTILLASGAYGTDKDKKVVQKILEQNFDINFAVVCGKNEDLYKFCESIKLPEDSKTTFKYVGFTNQMFLFNSASNLMLGKSGANALVESFYFGSPVIVTSHANLVEKYINDFYIGLKKCGKKIFDIDKIVEEVKAIIEDPTRLEEYQNNLVEFQDATGAEKVADILYEKLMERMKAKAKTEKEKD